MSDVFGVNPADILDGILDISSEAIMVADEQLVIRLASNGADAMFGYAPGELVGLSVEALIPERSLDVHRVHVANFSRRERSSLKMDERNEVFALRKDGTEFPIEASLAKRAHRGATYFTIIIRDVTARREAQARLAASERRLATAVANAELHVFEIDWVRREMYRDGIEGSLLFERLPTFEDLADDPMVVIAEEDRPAARAAWVKARRDGEPFRIECRMARSDGREAWALITAELIEDQEGRPLRLIGALQDVTQRMEAARTLRRAAEAAEAANGAKSAFLAIMSHEIRNPLNGVIGMAQAMAQDGLSPAQRERLGVIQDSSEALLTILNDILDLSKIEAGKLELEDVEFELGALIRSLEAAHGPAAGARGLALECDFERADGVYRGDPTRLRQILQNLLSNAVKFTRQGKVALTVRRQGENLVMSVADTGIGLTREQLKRLFQPFSQADSSTTRHFGGTGLGLSICRRLANEMGGGISVESRAGEGSTFTVRLPLPRVGEAGGTELAKAATGAANGGEPPHLPSPQLKVLAADDNAVNRLVLRTLLAQAGLEPTIADDGRQVVDRWRTGAFGIVLMDVHMPELDGVAAARLIRQEEADRGLPRTPIVALTADAMEHQIRGYLEAGMDACVTKPIDAGELLRTIEALTAQGGGEAPSKLAMS
ncbi:MAG: ATP-binding protein [Phenylobacterium sp.]|uniref:ATP-binding protein n=1 Tax=Phenylobacterium sp. TaxID=1871053 RepID=UPI002A359737|nr:ATP-binding protein [Phenylobacterium sp.]MDX9998520.1 ATP-binding protein [Phenylobacterium sp.]